MAQKRSPEKFKKEFEEMANGEYELLEEYVTNKTKITVKHIACGRIYEVIPYKIMNGSRCSVCQNEAKRKTTDEFRSEVDQITHGDFIVEGEYVDNKTKIEIRHKKCDRIFLTTPNSFLSGGHVCLKCYEEERTKTQEEFEREVFQLVGDEYSFLEPYINNYTTILVRHNKEGCSHIYKVRPTHFLHENKRCPVCKNMSVFAKDIKKVLEEYELSYEIEKRFNDLRNDNGIYYKYDFCIYNTDGTFFLLEYDGKQHSEAKYGNKELEKTIVRDGIKNQYCFKNNYQLIRLKYEQEGIGYKEALLNILRQYRLIA